MANDQSSIKDRVAASAADSGEPAAEHARQLPPRTPSSELDTAEVKAAEEARGFNPYDTTGGFDRKKNWAQVRKR